MGFLVERGTPGFTTGTIHGKYSLRASDTGELVFDGVKLPDSARLPEAKGLKAPLSCLNEARYGITWGAVGAAGTTDEFSPGRHMANLESVYTYEGTHDIHTLIVGADVTGLQAFR